MGPMENVSENDQTTSKSSSWFMFITEDGITAYANKETGETTWTQPDDFIDDASAKRKSFKFVHSSKKEKMKKKFTQYKTEDGETAIIIQRQVKFHGQIHMLLVTIIGLI